MSCEQLLLLLQKRQLRLVCAGRRRCIGVGGSAVHSGCGRASGLTGAGGDGGGDRCLAPVNLLKGEREIRGEKLSQ